MEADRRLGEVERVARFSDTIFAVALVLPVAHILLPENYVTSGVLHDAIGDASSQLFGAAVAFAAVGLLWIEHHRLFDHLKARDEAFLWLNGLFLGCVVLLSYPAAVLSKHIGAPVAILVFAGAMAITSLVWAGLWWWVSGQRVLVDSTVDIRTRRRVLRRSLTTPVAFALGCVVAPVVFSVRGTEVSLALIAWIVLVPALRVLASRPRSAP